MFFYQIFLLSSQIVQPDSLCKFKTTLAIDYVRDILDETSSIYRPINQRKGLKKKGQLKPLLGTGQHGLQPNVTKCLGIQNGNDRGGLTPKPSLCTINF